MSLKFETNKSLVFAKINVNLFCKGIASMSVPIYLSECAPKESRGSIITINNLSLTGGQFLSAFVCAILSDVDSGWRYMLGLAAVPAVVQFFGFIFLLPESPRKGFLDFGLVQLRNKTCRNL